MDDAPRLATDLLVQLRRLTGFDLVMTTRCVGEEWRVVAATESSYGVEAGDTFRWSDSICSVMARSGAPGPWTIADVDVDVAACTAPIRSRVPIASYLGLPLTSPDGELLGTLCAISPEPVTTEVDTDLLDFAADLVTWTYAHAQQSVASERAAERHLFPQADQGARLLPAASWQRLLEVELERCRWTGDTLTAGIVRVQGGGRASERADLAHEIARRLGSDDAVAMLGSNRIGVTSSGANAVNRLEAAVASLREAGTAVEVALTVVTGADRADTIVHDLDVQLVGAGAAGARAAVAHRVHHFCQACGRKGRYEVPGAGIQRCKYCSAISPAPAGA